MSRPAIQMRPIMPRSRQSPIVWLASALALASVTGATWLLFRGQSRTTETSSVAHDLTSSARERSHAPVVSRARSTPRLSTRVLAARDRFRSLSTDQLDEGPRAELLRLDVVSRQRAAEAVSLSDDQLALVIEIQQRADARRAALEGEREPVSGASSRGISARLRRSQQLEMQELGRLLGADRADRFLEAERQSYRELWEQAFAGTQRSVAKLIAWRRLVARTPRSNAGDDGGT